MRNVTKFHRSRKAQAGISTMHVLVAVLVAAVVAAGGVPAFKYVTQAQMNNEQQEINDMVGATKQFAVTRGGSLAFTTANVTISNLNASGFFAHTAGTGATATASTSTGKNVASVGPINVDTGTATSPNGIQIVLSGFTAKECLDLVPKISGSVARIESPAGSLLKPNGGVLDQSATTTQCSAQSDNVSLVLGMRG